MSAHNRCLILAPLGLLIFSGMAFAGNQKVDGVEIYVPDSLKPGEKLRGGFEMRVFDGAKRWVDSPYMRDFANRAKFVLTAGMPSHARVAAAIGHPEYANLPTFRFGHSAGGIKAWNEAVVEAERPLALGVIGHHAPIRGTVPEKGDIRGTLPTLLLEADRDFPGGSRSLQIHEQVGQAQGAGWVWSTVMQHGVSHLGIDLEQLRWLAYWLEDVAALQLPESIPDDGQVKLKTIDVTKGWVAYAEFVATSHTGYNDKVGIEHDRYQNVACYPYAQSPGSGMKIIDGRTASYIWMPSERVAKYWVNFQKYGNIEGDTKVRQTRVWDMLNDGIAGTSQGYEKIDVQGWNCPTFDILNVPDFDHSDHSKVQWSIVSGTFAPGLSINSSGKITGSATTAGIYKYTLRATLDGKSWDEVHYLPLRPSNAANELTINIREPANLADVILPLSIKWESNQPLGLLEWHSSVDGDLGVSDGELGSSGTINLEKLTPGTHAITLHAYSSTKFHREAQTVVVNVSGGPKPTSP